MRIPIQVFSNPIFFKYLDPDPEGPWVPYVSNKDSKHCYSVNFLSELGKTILFSVTLIKLWTVPVRSVVEPEPTGAEVFISGSRSRFKIWSGAGADILGRLWLLLLTGEQ